MKKNKLLSLLLCFVICVSVFVGCIKKENHTPKPVVPEKETEEKVSLDSDIFPLDMMYSSGAGGWGTQITLKEDGTFVGEYHDSEMGINGVGFDATVYICNFHGKYEIREQIDEYSYNFVFTEVITEQEKDTEWIDDRIKYIYSEPFGVVLNTEYILYTDETPVKNLSEDAIMWWPLRYNYQEDNIETLSCYGLYNESESIGFFSLE